MKSIPLIAALVLGAAFPARGQVAAKGGDVERQLIGLEHEWSSAIVKRDAAVMDRILAGDYVLTTPEGRVVTKAQILESFRSPRSAVPLTIRDIELDDVDARVYGNVGVISCRFILKGRVKGRDVETPFRHTDVFVKHQDRWQCVNRQATRITESYDPAGEHGGRPGGASGGDKAHPRFGVLRMLKLLDV